MVAPLEDIERLFSTVKHLCHERRKMERLSEKARTAPLGKQGQKATVDLNWQAFHVNKLEHDAHAAAVDCGLADARSPDHYKPYSVKLSGFHEYEVIPPLPRRVAARQKGGDA